jgi:uroporphyrinogen-III synthase
MLEVATKLPMQALVTRPRAAAPGLATALAARGIGAIAAPVLEIHWRDDGPLDLAGVQAVLCTSANGVRALARLAGERRVPLYAVGAATAAQARAEGFSTVFAAAGDVAALTRLAAERLRPEHGRLVHVAGSDVAGDLVGVLARLGFDIVRETVYEARPAAALDPATVRALRAGEVGFALFFSPRTGAVFARLAIDAALAPCCAAVAALSISSAADAQLGSLRWRLRRIAERPTEAALLAALDRLLAERSTHVAAPPDGDSAR